MVEITIERIVALNAAYIRCIDNGELESWPDFFLDDCRYVVTSADNWRNGLPAGIVYADSKAMLFDRVTSLRKANIYEKQSYRHILGLPSLFMTEGHETGAETPFMVARIMHDGQTDLFATGLYRDAICAVGNGLKFRERVVVCDSSRIDTLLALPL